MKNQHALMFGSEVIDGSLAEIITIDEQDFADTWDTFRRFADKEWSFTDCSSRTVMQRLGIGRALAFDEHFRQFGTVMVVP